ncbi:MAG: transposase [Thermoanaerobaculia bacterium]
MARVPRQVFPGVPHHVVQRGSRRAPVFFGPEDYRRYLRLLRRYCRKYAVEAWCYCLMPNHVHLILCPATEDALSKALGEAHRRYAWEVNRRHEWVGHLWQERFHSFAMDEVHLLAAVRYVLLNPVRAGLSSVAAAWPYSSARAHLGVADDVLVDVRPLEQRIESWAHYLRPGPADLDELVRDHSRSGRPLGSESFVERCTEIAAARRATTDAAE